MCDKEVNRCFFVFDSILNRYKTQEGCEGCEDPFLIVYCPDKNKTQRMCDEAVDNCLEALKFIRDWLVTSNMIKNFLLLCTQMIIYSILIRFW